MATGGDVAVVALNSVMTLVAVALVDRKGRTFLLKIGTAGIIVALAAATFVFHGVEADRHDVRAQVQAAVSAGELAIPLNSRVSRRDPSRPGLRADRLLRSRRRRRQGGHGAEHRRGPRASHRPRSRQAAPLKIKRASFGPVATEATGWLMMALMCLFIASFAVGPGVVVWLALSELMPTRIRSTGMGIALLVNQGVSTLMAGVFLPVVGYYGYYAMFAFWAVCTVVYFLISAFVLPETKGKTLEEIEHSFESKSAAGAPRIGAA